MKFSAREKLAGVEREIQMRERVYGRRVEINQMRKQDADREIALMRAIADDYRPAAEEERKREELF